MITNKYRFFIPFILFFVNTAHADNLVDQGAGYLGRSYLQRENLGRSYLPSYTFWKKELDGKQALEFQFTQKTKGQKPESFRSPDRPINGFLFEAPIATTIHFEGISYDAKECTVKPQGKVSTFYRGRYVDFAEDSEIYLDRDEQISFRFDLNDWSTCSLKNIKFIYYLTGRFTLTESLSKTSTILYNGSEKSQQITVAVPAINYPIFRYFAKEVGFDNLDVALKNCQTEAKVDSAQYSANFPQQSFVSFKAICPQSISPNKVTEYLKNPGSIHLTFEDVVAQRKMPYAPDLASKTWFVNPSEPIYHYRRVEAVGLLEAGPRTN